MRNNRLGKLYISTEFLTSDEILLKDTLHTLFSKVTPLKIDTELFSNKTLVIGICDFFRKLNDGEQIPMYEVIFTESEGINSSLKLEISFNEISDTSSEHYNV